jgi:hypothetical protein
LSLCDECIFYNNTNGFVEVAKYKNAVFEATATFEPHWIETLKQKIKAGGVAE